MNDTRVCFKSVEERFHVSWKISLSLERPVCKVGLWLATKSLNLWRTPHYFVTRRWGSLCLSCSYKHYNAIHSGQLKILTKKHCGLLGTLGYPSGTWNLFMCQTGVPAWPVPRRYCGWVCDMGFPDRQHALCPHNSLKCHLGAFTAWLPPALAFADFL